MPIKTQQQLTDKNYSKVKTNRIKAITALILRDLIQDIIDTLFSLVNKVSDSNNSVIDSLDNHEKNTILHKTDVDISKIADNLDALVLQQAKNYTDSKVANVYTIVGEWDASSGILPISGSADDGSIKKGDTWRISVAGAISGENFAVGDTLTAIFNKATNINQFIRGEKNDEEATEQTLGLVKKASQIETETDCSTSESVVTVKSLWFWFAAKFKTLQHTWLLLQIFSGGIRLPNLTSAKIVGTDLQGNLVEQPLSAGNILIGGVNNKPTEYALSNLELYVRVGVGGAYGNIQQALIGVKNSGKDNYNFLLVSDVTDDNVFIEDGINIEITSLYNKKYTWKINDNCVITKACVGVNYGTLKLSNIQFSFKNTVDYSTNAWWLFRNNGGGYSNSTVIFDNVDIYNNSTKPYSALYKSDHNTSGYYYFDINKVRYYLPPYAYCGFHAMWTGTPGFTRIDDLTFINTTGSANCLYIIDALAMETPANNVKFLNGWKTYYDINNAGEYVAQFGELRGCYATTTPCVRVRGGSDIRLNNGGWIILVPWNNTICNLTNVVASYFNHTRYYAATYRISNSHFGTFKSEQYDAVVEFYLDNVTIGSWTTTPYGIGCKYYCTNLKVYDTLSTNPLDYINIVNGNFDKDVVFNCRAKLLGGNYQNVLLKANYSKAKGIECGKSGATSPAKTITLNAGVQKCELEGNITEVAVIDNGNGYVGGNNQTF